MGEHSEMETRTDEPSKFTLTHVENKETKTGKVIRRSEIVNLSVLKQMVMESCMLFICIFPVLKER